MREWIGMVCALAAGLAILAPGSGAGAAEALDDLPVWQAKVFGCQLVDGDLVCGKNNTSDTGNQGTKAKKSKGTGNQGERACPPGYVVLAEKNKYGAFCEPKEGLPAPAPAQAEACKFGMIGTPPNDCHCPAGQDFQGYKGCVAMAPAKIGYECDADVSPVNVGHSYYTMAPPLTEQEARAKFAKNAKDSGYVITGPVTCKPVTYR